MLTISKNSSKSSKAVVKFTSKKPAPKPAPKPMPMPILAQIPPNMGRGVQNSLTEATFRQYLVGFYQILPKDLPAVIGKRLRYAIDSIDKSGRVISTQYRLGGIVKAVTFNTVVMFNPGARITWTLNLRQPNKRIRLYSNVLLTNVR